MKYRDLQVFLTDQPFQQAFILAIYAIIFALHRHRKGFSLLSGLFETDNFAKVVLRTQICAITYLSIFEKQSR
jgi:hypothetical protein